MPRFKIFLKKHGVQIVWSIFIASTLLSFLTRMIRGSEYKNLAANGKLIQGKIVKFELKSQPLFFSTRPLFPRPAGREDWIEVGIEYEDSLARKRVLEELWPSYAEYSGKHI